MFNMLVSMHQIIPLLQFFIPFKKNLTCYSKAEYRFGISTFDLIKIIISGRCFFPKLKFVVQYYCTLAIFYKCLYTVSQKTDTTLRSSLHNSRKNLMKIYKYKI